MSFTMLLALAYGALLSADTAAFIYGRRRRKWALFIGITSLLAAATVLLWHLWITSPM